MNSFKAFAVLAAIVLVLASTADGQCPNGPCPGSLANGCNWCAPGGALYMKYIGTCSNGCAIFRPCGTGTRCIKSGPCNVYCG